MTTDKWATLLEPTPESLQNKKVSAQKETASLQETLNLEMAPAQTKDNVLSVSDVNGLLKKQIEEQFSSVWIRGEVSNFKAHTSGHFYFSLKDDKSQISAVMFKGFNSRLKFLPESGMEVMVRGRVTVYEPRGTYQIFCETMEPVGAGALQKAFEQLKEKLRLEGLFSDEHKKPLPALPKNIGIVTSPTGAAIQDILNVLSRRYNGAQITLIPARVQGDGASREIVRGIELANQLNIFDVLIVGRGGGSIEDLWCFNEEAVARAIFRSKIPIISAVGHEIDFTIADFVADVRAPTPSAAAEIVAKSAHEIAEKISNFDFRLRKTMQLYLQQKSQTVAHLKKRLVDPKRRLEDLILRCDEVSQRLLMAWSRYKKEKEMQVLLFQGRLLSPKSSIYNKKTQRQSLEQNLHKAMRLRIERLKTKTTRSIAMLDSLSPLRVLSRGYSIAFVNGAAVKSIRDVQVGAEIKTLLHDGQIISSIKELKNIKE